MFDTSVRLLHLLHVLQSRRFWGGSELAARLEVTPRTLRRDIERLRSLGYVVEATSGPGGGYQLGKANSLPPLLLDDDEAVAVAVALRAAVDSFADMGERALRVLTRIEQLLPVGLRNRVSAVAAMTVSVDAQGPMVPPDLLTTLAGACRDRERLQFAYRDRNGVPSHRSVEPLRLAHAGARRWYLVGWDLDRCDWRTFRVDRIEGEVERGAHFPPRELPEDVASYVSRSIHQAPCPFRATVRLQGRAEELAQRIPVWCGILEPEGASTALLRTAACSMEGLVSQILLCGADFELVEPLELLPEIRALAQRLERAVKSAAARGAA